MSMAVHWSLDKYFIVNYHFYQRFFSYGFWLRYSIRVDSIKDAFFIFSHVDPHLRGLQIIVKDFGKNPKNLERLLKHIYENYKSLTSLFVKYFTLESPLCFLRYIMNYHCKFKKSMLEVKVHRFWRKKYHPETYPKSTTS